MGKITNLPGLSLRSGSSSSRLLTLIALADVFDGLFSNTFVAAKSTFSWENVHDSVKKELNHYNLYFTLFREMFRLLISLRGIVEFG